MSLPRRRDNSITETMRKSYTYYKNIFHVTNFTTKKFKNDSLKIKTAGLQKQLMD